MTLPAITAQNAKPTAKPLWQADETFWQRYSPHHEFPLATVSAITLCGLAIGFLFLLWILALGVDNEADGPPRTDAVTLEGGGGGYDGLGTGDSALGPKSKGQTEAVAGITKTPHDERLDPRRPSVPDLPDVLKATPLETSLPPDLATPEDAAILESLKTEAAKTESEQKIAAAQAAVHKAAGRGQVGGVGGPPGGRNTPGTGGGEGGGIGKGTGNKIGDSSGTSPTGRFVTRQEVLAKRWRFDLSGEGADHANKLVAIGVTPAVAGPDGRLYLIRDLKKRPIDLVLANISQHKDEVKWWNTKPESLRNLATYLGLRFVPRYVILFLPQEREQKMAALEHEAMERQGRQPQTVTATWFDFRLQNGVYEPVVIRLE